MNNKPIKIVHLITGLNVGGAEMILRDIVTGLDRDRFDPLVISILPLGPIAEMIQTRGVKVVSLEAASKFDCGIFFSLVGILKKEKPDIVHTHLFHADMLGRFAARKAKIKIVVSSIQNVSSDGWPRACALSATRGMVSGWVAVAEAVRRAAVKDRTADPNKTVVIYNAVESDAFTPKPSIDLRRKLGFSPREKILLAVGRLTEQKGFPYLIAAFSDIATKVPAARLIILGEGSDRRRLSQDIEHRGLAEKITLQGIVPNVAEYLHMADLFVMSSLWEGFSVALVEAALAGIPIVATNVSGNPEIIEDGVTGLLVPPHNPSALAEQVLFALGLPQEKIRAMTDAASAVARERFSADRMVSAYEDYYEKLIQAVL